MAWKRQISPQIRGREEVRKRKLSSDPVNLETTGRRAGAVSPGHSGPPAQAGFIGAPNLFSLVRHVTRKLTRKTLSMGLAHSEVASAA